MLSYQKNIFKKSNMDLINLNKSEQQLCYVIWQLGVDETYNSRGAALGKPSRTRINEGGGVGVEVIYVGDI